MKRPYVRKCQFNIDVFYIWAYNGPIKVEMRKNVRRFKIYIFIYKVNSAHYNKSIIINEYKKLIFE